MNDEPLDSNQFQGGVFSKELPNGRASAVITLELSYIRAKTSNGQEFTLRYSETNLDMGGSSGRMVFCRNADKSLTIFCEDKKFPAALELESSGELRDQLEKMLGSRKKEKWSGRFWFVTLSAISVVLLIGLYIGIKLGAKAAVHALPYGVDEKIGEIASEQMQDGFPEARDKQVVDAIETIVRRLETHSGLPNAKFTVRVVDGPIMNAYALPGGYITVYTGLIDESESAEEVAGVIAHEMAHVTLRHGIERIAGQVGIVIGVQLIFGDASGIIALGAELGQYAAENSYSRGQETEADLEGARMLYEAGIDPLSVVPLFEDLKKLNDVGIPAWMTTHPDTQDRIDRLKAYAGTLAPRQYDTFDEIDWAEVKRLAKRGEAADADDAPEQVDPAPEN
ncbi:MAG TPA: M48 family metallopeptidase [Planctomycetaceae bacterium]|nr:M48 family metallopeptidase [Planctomycetaceae bacterium]